jgi:hypothetical protein
MFSKRKVIPVRLTQKDQGLGFSSAAPDKGDKKSAVKAG